MNSGGRRVLARFVRVAKPFWTSEARWQALGLLAALFTLLLTINGLNIVMSYVGRDFITALATRQAHQVYVFALIYLGVFAAAAAVAALARFVELLLGLRWREWLTRRFLHQYLSAQAYFHLNSLADVDNPDQRISEDIRTFTSTSLTFLIMATNSVITIIAFTGVLWSITPWLLLAGVLYPLAGTAVIVWLGRRLVGLNNLQLKKEADFRFELVHVRTHAESLALVQSEDKEEARLRDRLAALVANYRAIITVVRNLEFVTGGYNYLTQLIPVLIVAPLYLRGEVEFGVVTQAAMAFSQIFNAFSLVVAKFQDLSTFAAVVGRLGTLEEALAAAAAPTGKPIAVTEKAAPLAFDRVTLRSPIDDRPVVQDLCLEVPRGRHILLTETEGAGHSALMRATAGLWTKGRGQISRPSRWRVLFLPEQPYMLPGTLRDQFIMPGSDGEATDQRMFEALNQVHLETLVRREGGLDAERDWAAMLSLGEQQRLAFARLLVAEPDFAFLDHATSAMTDAQEAELYQLLAGKGISCISVGDRRPSLLGCHDTLLELRPDGGWSARPIEPSQQPPRESA